jgi:hypothetical protein
MAWWADGGAISFESRWMPHSRAEQVVPAVTDSGPSGSGVVDEPRPQTLEARPGFPSTSSLARSGATSVDIQ